MKSPSHERGAKAHGRDWGAVRYVTTTRRAIVRSMGSSVCRIGGSGRNLDHHVGFVPTASRAREMLRTPSGKRSSRAASAALRKPSHAVSSAIVRR
jgi:hypothetical protein